MRTAKGQELATSIRSQEHECVDVAVCSLICRAAVTYARIQEDMCNGHPFQGMYGLPIETVNKAQRKWEARCDRENDRLERLIRRHAAKLPQVKEVQFGGDLRGCTVTLALVSGKTNDWGRKGIVVPGS